MKTISLPGRLSLRVNLALGALFMLGAFSLFFPAIVSQFTMYCDKVDQIPDIKQTDRRLNFPQHGRDFCAPVVVVDSLIWLYKHDYDRILAQSGNDADLPVSACRKLSQLMHTTDGPGTPTENFLAGVKQYIEQCTPYSIKSLKYEGWNRHSHEFDHGKAIPDLDWIKAGVRGHNSAWINIGWYQEDPGTKELKRVNGHWVTLVGYGTEIDGVANPNTLIVRDPDPVLSEEPRKIFITVEPLSAGTITGPHEGLPRSARGYLRTVSMGNGIDTSRKRIGIIDGAIVLELWPAWFGFGR